MFPDLMSIESKPNAVRGEKARVLQRAEIETVSPHTAMETADATPSLPTNAQQQRIEQMYQLADIFASIFEALPDDHAHAIATMTKAA